MNYIKLYDKLCEYCRETTPLERLYRRNKQDVRLQEQCDVYTERHHIVPRHSKGSDDVSNIIVVLPEEHFLLHLIRYKAYNEKKDFIACRVILNGINRKICFLGDKHTKYRFKNKRVALFRQMIYEFRKKHDWHTKTGIERISKARLGKMPCMDVNTGKSVGMQPCDHPLVVSGEWVHQSTGKVCVIDVETNEKLQISTIEYHTNKQKYKLHLKTGSGSNNNNYKEMTANRRDRLYKLVPLAIVEGHFISKLFEKHLKEEFSGDFSRVSLIWITNNFSTLENFLNTYNKIHNTSYIFNPYFRSTSQRLAASNMMKLKKKNNRKDSDE